MHRDATGEDWRKAAQARCTDSVIGSLCGREAVLSLTKAEKADARLLFEAGTACEHCGGLHQRACPRVRRIEKHPNGNVTAVTYWRKWDQAGVVFPEDAYDPEDGEGAANGP